MDAPRSGTPAPGTATAPPWTRADAVALVAVLGISAALVWPELFRGWYPWDDGAMAQVAERVMHGQLPHRDFDDPWTGGWSFVQAGIFRLFGTSLRMLRIPIFVVWLASLACGFRLARRFVSPAVAGAATLAWGVWSLYAWHYPLLNWYYAPLALFAAWGVTRFVESGRRRYVVLAGVCVGVAIAFKITGLYLLAAMLLWCAAHVVFGAQRARGTGESRGEGTPARSLGYAVLVTVSGVVFILLVARLVWSLPAEARGSVLFHYVVPAAATVLWLGWRARDAGISAGAGTRELLSLLVPLAAGVMLPLLPLFLGYAAIGALTDLYVGVLVRPSARMTLLPWPPPPGRVASAGMMLAPILLVIGVRYAKPSRGQASAVLAVALGLGAGVLAHHDEFTATSVSLMVRVLPVLLPLVALWGSVRGEEMPGGHGSVVFLLVAFAATAQLLQVPQAYLPYSLYATPLTILALVAMLAHRGDGAPPAILLAGSFLIAAGYGHPATAVAKPESARWAQLALPRGGLWVSPEDSAQFAGVARLVSGRPVGPIHVVGDAPEYAFLLDRPSVSRVIYDVLADSSAKDARLVLPMLARARVQTVILLNQFGMNDSLTTRQVKALRGEFPASRQFGRFVFDGRTLTRVVEVRWRGDSLR